jgi:hypothetical protein
MHRRRNGVATTGERELKILRFPDWVTVEDPAIFIGGID